MTLLPIAAIALYVAWRIYREHFQLRAARRFVRVDYHGQRQPRRRR